MPKTRKEKETIVKNLAEKLGKTKSVVLTNYQGLTVNQIQELKKEMEKTKAEYAVVKNTLFLLALDKSKLSGVKIENLTGPLALGFGFEDEVSAAKNIYNFARKNKLPKILSGILENRLLTKEETVALAQLPTKDELIAKTVYTISAPLSSFIQVLSANLRNFVYVLNAIKDDRSVIPSESDGHRGSRGIS
jgi:large subunit ribosomal protein L10